MVAAVSYPFTGDPWPDAATFLREIPRIRGAFLDTPPAIMLALDYLLRRPDVDRARVETVGASLGAPFVCIAGALDPRITRVWALHGSGGSYAPLEANMRRTIHLAPVRVLAGALAIGDGWIDRARDYDRARQSTSRSWPHCRALVLEHDRPCVAPLEPRAERTADPVQDVGQQLLVGPRGLRQSQPLHVHRDHPKAR